MAKVLWPEQAIDDLDQIIQYIQQFDPAAARDIRAKLFQLGESLAPTVAVPHQEVRANWRLFLPTCSAIASKVIS